MRNPAEVLKEVRELLDDNDILFSDVGQHKMMIARHYEAREPGTVWISNGFCSMGGGLAGAIGASLAKPKAKVMAIIGDGGFQMAMSELETAVRLNSDITVQIWVDGGFGLIKWKQDQQFGSHTQLDFGNPKFKLIAEAFGWHFAETLKEGLDHTGPSMVIQQINYK